MRQVGGYNLASYASFLLATKNNYMAMSHNVQSIVLSILRYIPLDSTVCPTHVSQY